MIEGFAVDLGGTKTAAARIIAGRIESRIQIPTDGGADFQSQMEAIAGLLEQLGYRHGSKLGVAVAGRIDDAGRWQAVNAHTLSGIDGKPLLQDLQKRFGENVIVRNDAAAAALAEARLGAGAGAEHFAYVTVSTGIGGGIVLKGRLLKSRNGLAGHMGFLSSPLSTEACGSGRRGTVEAAASGRAIAARAGVPSAREAFEAGTPQAEAAIDRSAAAIARLCVDLTALFGLDKIALGGSIGLSSDYQMRVHTYLETEPLLFRVPVVPALLGQDSVLFGALIADEHWSDQQATEKQP